MRYPKQEIARLYKLRWEIETNFHHLKTTMKMEHLKCQTPDGVMKELMVFALVYNLFRTAMHDAAQRQEVLEANRISFIDAARWMMRVLTSCSPEQQPDLAVNPIRPGRWQPRVKKRRMKQFSRMSKSRSLYTQRIEEKAITL